MSVPYFGHCILYIAIGVVLVSGECGDPPTIDHTTNDISGNPPFIEGTLVTYTCVVGYKGEGKPSYTCFGGQWTGGSLQCHQISCGDVNTPENGYISNQPQYVAGTSITFECDPGYDLEGTTASLVCLVTGEWHPPNPPSCNIKHCPDFPSIPNGNIFQDTIMHEANVYGSLVEITCESGYVINGNTNVRCTAEGIWETPPTCKKIDCGTHPGLSSSCIKNTFLGGNTLFITCEDHATLVSGIGGSDDCNEDTSQWDHPDMTCKCGCHVDPGPGLILKNADDQNYIKHDTLLDWDCSSGRKSVVKPLKCTDGVIEQPVCIERNLDNDDETTTCGKLPAIKYAYYNITDQSTYEDGNQVKYSCKVGFAEVGNPIFICRAGKWQGSEKFNCRQITCAQMKKPQNGFISNQPKYIPGSKIEFDCDKGYDIVGPATLVCGTDGEWSPHSRPSCSIKTCPDFPDVLNGNVSQSPTNIKSNVFGSEVVIKCNSGYILNGLVKVRCRENGKWETAPTCDTSDCGPHPGLDSSCITSTSLTDKGTLFIICDEYATLVEGIAGSDDCMEGSNQWGYPQMTCKCGCRIEPAAGVTLISNISKDGYIHHNETLSWKCSDGSTKSTKTPLLCTNGVIDQPTCIISSTPAPVQSILPWIVMVLITVLAVVAAVGAGYYFKCKYRKKYKKRYAPDKTGRTEEENNMID